ncbi:hypothetical protein BDP81DRAFT_187188 [Colletotrichum phormii]|uniref:Uncharacterized protein n=1 Tax=Colletotrichum phormii TaxID=359342 RepID=A0AAJ0E968_9PEZI|nr:uncharacterized protein BDP81DRAFT_187188 [Colletotrichum phormii]KAK1621453.1 hypothetical protein BDP81DRAFT_187188 [Colletotrichum phormii]
MGYLFSFGAHIFGWCGLFAIAPRAHHQFFLLWTFVQISRDMGKSVNEQDGWFKGTPCLTERLHKSSPPTYPHIYLVSAA